MFISTCCLSLCKGSPAWAQFTPRAEGTDVDCALGSAVNSMTADVPASLPPTTKNNPIVLAKGTRQIMTGRGRGLADLRDQVATRRAKAISLQVDRSADVTHTSQQVRRRVRPVVGPDQLPVEVVVLTLPVVAEARLGVLVKSAASCSKEKKKRRKGYRNRKRRKRTKVS